jgi:hypothetical protein
MRHIAAVLTVSILLTTAVGAGAMVAGPDPAQFLKLYETETNRFYLTLYVLGVSDALQHSNQIKCHHKEGAGPTAEAMTAEVADVLRGPDPPQAVAIAVLRVMRAGGCTRPARP